MLIEKGYADERDVLEIIGEQGRVAHGAQFVPVPVQAPMTMLRSIASET
jgi:hypothetical protein